MLLKDLTQLNGVSGNEHAVRAALMEQVTPLCDEVSVDTMGNLFAVRNGTDAKAPHIMLAAHMDEVGFMVLSITEEGMLRIAPVGGVDPRVVVSKRVLAGENNVPGVIGAKAIHLQSESDFDRVLGFEHLYVDIGASSKSDAEKLCPAGTFIAFDSAYVEFGDQRVKAKALDDRLGCLALLRALKESKYPGKLTCAFTVQEEVGLRGAQIAAHRVNPDLALVLEGTTCNDLGGVDHHLQVTRQGDGVALSFMDRTTIVHKGLLAAIQKVGTEHNIPWQLKQFVAGGTDAGAIHQARGGIPCAVLAVPCRYIHSPSSVAHLGDVAAQQNLLLACLDAFAAKNPIIE